MELEVIHRSPRGQAKPTPLLFVHGKWHGAWCWEEYFLPYFAENDYEAYALSLRGHGRSAGRIWGSTIADYVEDVVQVASQLERPPVIIGHSMGGFLTQKYLEKHQAPAAVLLTAVPPYGLWPTTFSLLRRKPLPVLKSIFTLHLYPLVATPELARYAFFSEDMPEEKVRAYHKKLIDESFRAYMDELGLNLVRTKRIKTPLLVLGALNDKIILPSEVKATAQRYGGQAELFDMAHDVMLESGWKLVADRIIGWLTERGL